MGKCAAGKSECGLCGKPYSVEERLVIIWKYEEASGDRYHDDGPEVPLGSVIRFLVGGNVVPICVVEDIHGQIRFQNPLHRIEDGQLQRSVTLELTKDLAEVHFFVRALDNPSQPHYTVSHETELIFEADPDSLQYSPGLFIGTLCQESGRWLSRNVGLAIKGTTPGALLTLLAEFKASESSVFTR
jgi:hypothetical protein